MSAPPPAAPALDVSGLSVRFAVGGKRWLQAVHNVSFKIERGETLGVVGESGSGKSTIARALLRLVPATAGAARFRGIDLLALQGPALRDMREHLQIIFQDPLASLDPRMSVAEIIEEPLRESRDRSGGTPRPGARHARPRGVAAFAPTALSARILRWPGTAHRHRARAHAATRTLGVR